MKHLWDFDHPYYMSAGAWNMREETHNEYESWAGFLENWGDGDLDYNLLIRWDWMVGKEDWSGQLLHGPPSGLHAVRYDQARLERPISVVRRRLGQGRR